MYELVSFFFRHRYVAVSLVKPAASMKIGLATAIRIATTTELTVPTKRIDIDTINANEATN